MWDNFNYIINSIFAQAIIESVMVVFFIYSIVHVFIIKDNDLKLNIADILLGASSAMYIIISIVRKIKHKRR